MEVCVDGRELQVYGVQPVREIGGALVEVVANFKYLGRSLDQMNNDWPAVRRNIMCARLVWGRLGTLP